LPAANPSDDIPVAHCSTRCTQIASIAMRRRLREVLALNGCVLREADTGIRFTDPVGVTAPDLAGARAIS